MESRHARSSSVISWILAIALTVSPLMAQSPSAPEKDTTENQAGNGTVSVPAEGSQAPAAPVVDESSAAVGTSVHTELPVFRPPAKFPGVYRHSTPLSSPATPGAAAAAAGARGDDSMSPGQSKWIITAVIVGTAAVVGIILLLRGFGGGSEKPKGPAGTILAPGTPSVTVPGR